MKASSSTSKIKTFREGIETKIKKVFNYDVFSMYEGIIEGIDNVNGLLKIRVPELNNTLYEECRVITFCSSPTISFTPSYEIGSHVILGFRMFSLNYPTVLGQISPIDSVNTPFTDNTVALKVGVGTIVMTPNSIELKCGDSTLAITETGIQLNGQYVTANSNDITKDDVGVL